MRFAACFGQLDRDPTNVAHRMARFLSTKEREQPTIWSVKRGAIGLVHTSDVYSAFQHSYRTEAGNRLVVSGVPINKRGGLTSTLRKAVMSTSKKAGEVLSNLDGAFAALHWDSKYETVTLVTDFLGLQPLYVYKANGYLLLANSVQSVTASALFSVEMDKAGWGSLISFGHCIGNRTLVDGVHRSKPARIQFFNPKTGSIQGKAYWRWPETPRTGTLKDADTSSIVDVLRRDSKAYCRHQEPGTLLLSGGFDSRLILSVLQLEDVCPNALIVSHPEELIDADGYLAERVARRNGLNYQICASPNDYYESPDYVDYLRMTDAMIPSFRLFIAKVHKFLNKTQAAWQGTAVGYLHVPHQPPGGFDALLKEAAAGWDSSWWLACCKIFGEQTAQDIYESFHNLMDRQRTLYPDDEHGVAEFLARNRLRNRTSINTTAVYSQKCLSFAPGFSRDFWELVGGFQYRWKRRYRLYKKLYRRHFPHQAALPFVSAGRLRGVLDSRTHMLADKLGTWLRRGAVPEWVGRCVQKLRLAGKVPAESNSFLHRTIQTARETHHDLHADGVRGVKKERPRLVAGRDTSVHRRARELLFYWKMWRRFMEEEPGGVL